MNPIELIGPAIAIVAGLLLLWWGVACRAGRFPRNPILGYRTPTALRSTPAWNAAHRGYAPWIISASVALVVAGIVVLIGVLAGVGNVLAPVLGVGVVVVLLALVVGGFFAHRSLAAYVRENEERTD